MTTVDTGPVRDRQPNVHDLTSGNPAMRYFRAALADLNLTYDDVHRPDKPALRGVVSVGKSAVLDRVMERAAELHAAAQ